MFVSSGWMVKGEYLQDVQVLWWHFLTEETCAMQENCSLWLLEQPLRPLPGSWGAGCEGVRAPGSHWKMGELNLHFFCCKQESCLI